MNTFQQWLLWMHIMCGSAIFVSIFVINVRKRAFEKRFGAILKEQQTQRRKRRMTFRDTSRRSSSMRRSFSFLRSRSQANETSGVAEKPVLDKQQKSDDPVGVRLQTDTGRSGGPFKDTEIAVESPTTNGALETPGTPQKDTKESTSAEPTRINPNQSDTDRIAFIPGTSFNPTSTMGRTSQIKRRNSVFSLTGVGASPVTTSYRRPFFAELDDIRQSPGLGLEHHPATPWHIGNLLRNEVIGRNSQFHGLTFQEREQLGGVEYRAVQLLSWVVPLYFVLWQLLGCLAVGAWMNNYASDITGLNGINAW
jgi:hypothetical protein